MGDFLGLLTFLISLILVLWVGGEMLASVLPTGVARFLRRALNLTLNVLDAMGEWAIGLVVALWRGRARPPQPAQVSTVSQARPLGYVDEDDEDAPLSATGNAVAGHGDEGRNAIATGATERNAVLSRNVVTRAQADIIARLLRAETLYIPDGKGSFKRMSQTALIELATGLKPNGRPESEYGLLRAELDAANPPTVTVRDRDGTRREVAKGAP